MLYSSNIRISKAIGINTLMRRYRLRLYVISRRYKTVRTIESISLRPTLINNRLRYL
jgi:hypothetical protein